RGEPAPLPRRPRRPRPLALPRCRLRPPDPTRHPHVPGPPHRLHSRLALGSIDAPRAGSRYPRLSPLWRPPARRPHRSGSPRPPPPAPPPPDLPPPTPPLSLPPPPAQQQARSATAFRRHSRGLPTLPPSITSRFPPRPSPHPRNSTAPCPPLSARNGAFSAS